MKAFPAVRSLYYSGNDEMRTQGIWYHTDTNTPISSSPFTAKLLMWSMHLSVVQSLLVSLEPIPFRTHLSTKPAPVSLMSGCRVIAVVNSQSSSELTWSIIWNTWSFSSPTSTTFLWFYFSLTCSPSPSCLRGLRHLPNSRGWNIWGPRPCSWFLLC